MGPVDDSLRIVSRATGKCSETNAPESFDCFAPLPLVPL